jgi:hypothetical protein
LSRDEPPFGVLLSIGEHKAKDISSDSSFKTPKGSSLRLTLFNFFSEIGFGVGIKTKTDEANHVKGLLSV